MLKKNWHTDSQKTNVFSVN